MVARTRPLLVKRAVELAEEVPETMYKLGGELLQVCGGLLGVGDEDESTASCAEGRGGMMVKQGQ